MYISFPTLLVTLRTSIRHLLSVTPVSNRICCFTSVSGDQMMIVKSLGECDARCEINYFCVCLFLCQSHMQGWEIFNKGITSIHSWSDAHSSLHGQSRYAGFEAYEHKYLVTIPGGKRLQFKFFFVFLV
jgi:hypothetical protein